MHLDPATMQPPLCLSADEVRRVLTMADAIAAMRDAFAQLSRGDVVLAERQHLPASEGNGVALIMPCYSPSLRLCSLKNITIIRENEQRGLPVIQSTLLITDAVTGSLRAIIEGVSLTAIRTGAASGLATDLLARRDAAVAAIIGTGVQARTQLEAVRCVRQIRLARIYDRNREAAERFAGTMRETLKIAVETADTPADALREADVICTATTSSDPVFADADVPPGAHINAIGSFQPEVTEIPAATVCRARVVVDHRASAMEEAGDLITPMRQGLIRPDHFRVELGEIVLGQAPGRQSDDEVTLFKSVGVAIQDLCAAAIAVENARRRGLGTIVFGDA